jgi:integrase
MERNADVSEASAAGDRRYRMSHARRNQQCRERLGICDPLVFPSGNRGVWNQRNALQSFYLFQRRLGLKRVGFHRLRHTFATEYLRRGGECDSRARWGHSQITTTCAMCRCLRGTYEQFTADYRL